ncbi:MAG: isoprenylcysteine carboxylmethyltransferase family protein [Deltaproteobacteria bacterium]|nr:isoprenylcysteine carboxylmethyltransferase family protein [Deltaproteobacteria bacterium]
MDKGLKRTTFWAIASVYLLIALEIIIMVSPFAGYFYSVYGPFLKSLSASPITSWLTDFFLPHMTFPDDPFLMAVGYIGPLLFYIGLTIFFSAFIPLYWSKFRGKGVVKGGLYSIVRHPQYLGLAIAGLGILLYWPRFFIVIMYITMLYLYYLLARDEEGRMERAFGDAYKDYKASIPMFIPGGPGRWLKGVLPEGRWGSVYGYIIALVFGIGIAFLLRAYTVTQIPSIKVDNITTISIFPMEEERMKGLIKIALMDDEVSNMIDEVERVSGRRPPAIYMMPADYAMMGLVSGVKKRYTMDGGHRHRRGGIWRHLTLLIHHLHMVGGKGVSEPPVMRLFFCEVRHGEERIDDPLGIGVKRVPLFYVDIDTKEGRVIEHLPTPPTHRWGDMPMPAF